MATMISVARRLQFCVGHRVVGHETKCRNLHGHNYVAFVYAQAPKLDHLGRVIDFGVLKSTVGRWVETCWDHGFVLWREDPLVSLWCGEDPGPATKVATGWPENVRPSDAPLVGHKLFVLPTNPTAENMASYLLTEVCPKLLEGTEVRVVRVELWETENCCAVAGLERFT